MANQKQLRLESFTALLDKDGYGNGARATFAREVGISKGHLHDILTGRREAPDHLITKFARRLLVSEAAIADLRIDTAAK